MPFHTLAGEINLERDIASEKSVWRFYRDLLALRTATPALTVGSFMNIDLGEGCCAFIRQTRDSKVLVVCNFEQVNQIRLPDDRGELLLSNYGHAEKNNGFFQPYEIAVFQLN
jgi:oligo-1,6-glucosidase